MRIGRHMPTNSKLLKAAQTAHEIGCEAMQIFASNPTAWKTPPDDLAGFAAFAETTRALQLDPVVLHAPYLINLGTTDASNWEKSITLLTWTLQRGGNLGAKYVVFHTGSHRGAGLETGIARVAAALEQILPNTPEEVILLLENGVGSGNAFGDQFEHLAAILALVPQYQHRLGVCIDTAHLWGAGHDISTPAAAQDVLQHCDATFGLDKLYVIHLNDTEKALGSHRDVHARIGEGLISSIGISALLQDPRLQHATVLLETPIKVDENDKEDWEHDAGEIAKVKTLAGRLPVIV